MKTKKLNKLLQKYLSNLVKSHIHIDDNNLMTITRIETSPDFAISIIFVSLLKNEAKILISLNKASKNMRNYLNKKHRKYKIPKLKFIRE